MVQGRIGAQSAPVAAGRIVSRLASGVGAILGGLLLISAAPCWSGRSGESAAAPLIVSAAASLTDAFRDIKALWLTQHPETPILFNLGASGTLEIQIEAGAPADVFAAAGLPPMLALARAGRVDSTEIRIFARNQLVLIGPREGPRAEGAGAIAVLKRLEEPSIRRIAIGDERTVPAGQYAAGVLRHYHLYTSVHSKLVPAETVRQVLAYVASGSVDAGFVYQSDLWPEADVRVLCVVPDEAHDPIVYPIARIKGGDHGDAAQEFVRFILGPDAQAVLRKYRFLGASLGSTGEGRPEGMRPATPGADQGIQKPLVPGAGPGAGQREAPGAGPGSAESPAPPGSIPNGAPNGVPGGPYGR